jgi:hypothetical protein
MNRIDTVLENLEILKSLGLGEMTINDLSDVFGIIKDKCKPKNDFIEDYQKIQDEIDALPGIKNRN